MTLAAAMAWDGCEATHNCCAAVVVEENFTRLCTACSKMCYQAPPIWTWDEDAIDSITRSGRLYLLHLQICLFYQRFQEQSVSQQCLRKSAADRIRRFAHLLWPSCQVHMYGSSASGLFLPSSDIDLLILGTGCRDSIFALDALAQHLLSARNRFSSLEVLRNARVPIVRFREHQSMLYFDVRIECSHIGHHPAELKAVEMIKNSLVELPAMGPLYVLLKTFLQEKGLNQLFQHGGIRPYMLFVMLKTFLLLADTYMGLEPYESPNLALLLLGFLHFYGTSFASKSYGISCRKFEKFHGNCFFFSKQPELHVCGVCPITERRGFYNPSHTYLLAVEDPLNPSNDLGRNSRKYSQIRGAFRRAYADLTAPMTQLLRSFIPETLPDDLV